MDAAKVGHLIIGGKILQRGVYQENSGTSKYDRNAWKYDPLNLPTLSSLNPSTNPLISYLFGEIKRGKDGNYYILQMSAIDKIHSYSANGVNPDVSLAATGYQMASSWPTQVYKVFEDPALTLSEYVRTVGNKSYELKDHLGNVRVVISDVKLGQDNTGADDIMDEFVPEVKSYSDYYAYGQSMPGRKWTSSDYRFGFNGKEKSDEIATGDYDFGARILDARIGRWMTWDPLRAKYPALSPYNFAADCPIIILDPDGRILRMSLADYKDSYKTVLSKIASDQINVSTSYDEKSGMVTINITAKQGVEELSSEAGRLIQLSGSKHEHLIQIEEGKGNHCLPTSKQGHLQKKDDGTYEPGEGSGSIITWDPTDLNGPEEEGPNADGQRGIDVSLNHEFIHAEQADEGRLDTRKNDQDLYHNKSEMRNPQEKPEKLSNSEVEARKEENRYREKKGEAPRKIGTHGEAKSSPKNSTKKEPVK